MLTDVDLRRCLFAVIELHERQRRKEAPRRASWTREMIEKLVAAITEVSQPRQATLSAPSCSEHADLLLSARQVSARLGWSLRRVQRHAAELGGRLVDGRLVFSVDAIDEHLGGSQ